MKTIQYQRAATLTLKLLDPRASAPGLVMTAAPPLAPDLAVVVGLPEKCHPRPLPFRPLLAALGARRGRTGRMAAWLPGMAPCLPQAIPWRACGARWVSSSRCGRRSRHLALRMRAPGRFLAPSPQHTWREIFRSRRYVGLPRRVVVRD